jgi:hypothetical protein
MVVYEESQTIYKNLSHIGYFRIYHTLPYTISLHTYKMSNFIFYYILLLSSVVRARMCPLGWLCQPSRAPDADPPTPAITLTHIDKIIFSYCRKKYAGSSGSSCPYKGTLSGERMFSPWMLKHPSPSCLMVGGIKKCRRRRRRRIKACMVVYEES